MNNSKILLVGNYLPDSQKSMNAYADMLVNGVRLHGHSVDLVTPPEVIASIFNRGSSIRKWMAYIDKFVIFSIALFFMQFRYSRVHVCDHSNAMYGYLLFGRNLTITCHDVIAIQAARGGIKDWNVSVTGKIFQALIFGGLKKFNKIFCVSKLTLKDLKGLGHDFDAHLAENALNGEFVPTKSPTPDMDIRRLSDILESKFFLHVGSDLPRKNRQFLLEVMRIMGEDIKLEDRALVFVGPLPSKKMLEKIRIYGLSNRVKFIQDVSHAELVLLYSRAEAFIFPSLNEGFGWPVAEAQACGCPVFASNIEPMPEVGGNAAVYFSPTNPQDCVNAILAANVAAMRVQGLENAKRFSMAEMLYKMDFL